jgi:glycosyltransferase involved in cell wall biosynthesis
MINSSCVEPRPAPVSAILSSDRRRVLHIINGEHYSGAERVQDLLASCLPEFGFDLGFACIKPNRFPEMRQSQQTPLLKVGMRSRFDWGCAQRVADYAREFDYELIHAHTPRSLMIGERVARQLDLPLIYHVHSPVGRDSTRGLRNRLNQWIETRSLKRADRMICVSQSIANYMQGLGHDAQRIAVVHNGVRRSGKRNSRPMANERWTLGTVALFRPRKGTEVLLDAIAELASRQIDVGLRAVGPFETEKYEREIMKRVEQLGIGDRVHWTGFSRDVESQLGEMDLFVLPSLFGEGLPMVVLEAMAIGLPTVASSVEGVPEAIRPGVEGLLFEPGNANDLADKIESMAKARFDWASMSRAAQQRQREHFSDSSMARGVSEVYCRVFR